MRMTFGHRIVKTRASKSALRIIFGVPGVTSCRVRDVSLTGTSLRLHGQLSLPIDFKLLFDGFRTTVGCRLIWRDGDFVGSHFSMREGASGLKRAISAKIGPIQNVLSPFVDPSNRPADTDRECGED